MKRILFLILLSNFALNSFSQTTEEKIENLTATVQGLSNKVDRLNSQLVSYNNQLGTFRTRLDDIEEVNQALKDKYELFQGSKNITLNGIELKLLSIKGAKSGYKDFNEIVIEYLVTNTNDQGKVAMKRLHFTDELGNVYETNEVQLGSKSLEYGLKIFPNSPSKIKIRYGLVEGKPIYVRKINFYFRAYDESNEFEPVSLDGGLIDWN